MTTAPTPDAARSDVLHPMGRWESRRTRCLDCREVFTGDWCPECQESVVEPLRLLCYLAERSDGQHVLVVVERGRLGGTVSHRERPLSPESARQLVDRIARQLVDVGALTLHDVDDLDALDVADDELCPECQHIIEAGHAMDDQGVCWCGCRHGAEVWEAIL